MDCVEDSVILVSWVAEEFERMRALEKMVVGFPKDAAEMCQWVCSSAMDRKGQDLLVPLHGFVLLSPSILVVSLCISVIAVSE